MNGCNSSDPSRRRFLLTCAAGTISGATAVGCSGGDAAEPEAIGDVDAGNVSAIAVGTLKALGTVPVAIGRDAGGLYAMTLTCTHQGCNMAIDGTVSQNQVACSCHGSVFDKNGGVVRGPARNALVHFLVEIDSSGKVTIRGSQQVSPSERTMV